MKNSKVNSLAGSALDKSKELALFYMKTLTEVARESFLLLDSDPRVISANPTFYQIFQVKPEQTENRHLYELGNGQWNIPELERLLEEILPNKKVVRDYEVTHVFQTIGEKTILLNARQIDSVQLIVLALEDITDKKIIENKKADYTKSLEVKVEERTKKLADQLRQLERLNKSMVGREIKMMKLKKEIESLKMMVENGNGKK
jgi:nitrogen-specific signal transduction histidine kinase